MERWSLVSSTALDPLVTRILRFDVQVAPPDVAGDTDTGAFDDGLE